MFLFEIPFYLFLFVYGLAVMVFLIFAGFLIYHALRYGEKNRLNYITLFLFLILAFIILASSFFYIIDIDWARTINFR